MKLPLSAYYIGAGIILFFAGFSYGTYSMSKFHSAIPLLSYVLCILGIIIVIASIYYYQKVSK